MQTAQTNLLHIQRVCCWYLRQPLNPPSSPPPLVSAPSGSLDSLPPSQTATLRTDTHQYSPFNTVFELRFLPILQLQSLHAAIRLLWSHGVLIIDSWRDKSYPLTLATLPSPPITPLSHQINCCKSVSVSQLWVKVLSSAAILSHIFSFSMCASSCFYLPPLFLHAYEVSSFLRAYIFCADVTTACMEIFKIAESGINSEMQCEGALGVHLIFWLMHLLFWKQGGNKQKTKPAP